MPISSKSLSLMAKTLKIDEATVKAALENEKEVDLEIPEVKVFSTEELTTFEKNIDDEAFKRGVDHKSKNAEEMFIKNIRQKEGLTLSENTTDGLLEAIKGKYSGDKKELMSKFENEKKELVSNYETQVTTVQSKAEQLAQQLKNKDLQFKLYAASPESLSIKREHSAKLFLSDVQWDKDAQDRDVMIVNGKKQVDNTLNPLPIEQVYNDWIVKNEYIKTPPGRGGGDEGGSGGTGGSLASFNKEMQDKGIHPGSSEYNNQLHAKAAADPEFKKEVLASE